MREEILIKALIIIGIFSLAFIAISTFLLRKAILRFSSGFAPQAFCSQDYKGEFILAKQTSYEVCDKVDDIKELINPEICEGFEEEKREACLGLVKIAENRSSDCLTILFGKPKTSVDPEVVKKYCEVFNITPKNVSIPKFVTAKRCYSHNDCWFTEYSRGCCLGQCNLKTNECFSSPQAKDYTAYGQEYFCTGDKVCGADCKCHYPEETI